MDSITFRVAQRKILLIWSAVGAVCIALAALALVLHGYGAAILLGAFGLVVTPAGLDLAAGRTDLTPDGLETRTLFRKRFCRWDEIEAIGTRVRKGRGQSNTRIVVHLKIRKPIKLRAPYDSSVGGDPHFTESLQQIKGCWRKQTTR